MQHVVVTTEPHAAGRRWAALSRESQPSRARAPHRFPAATPRGAPDRQDRAASDRAGRELLLRLAADPTPAARRRAIEHFLPLSRALARRYHRGGEPLEDLEQVAARGCCAPSTASTRPGARASRRSQSPSSRASCVATTATADGRCARRADYRTSR